MLWKGPHTTPTKVFISWSGDLSRKLGEALRDWLPKALQSVKPYFSPNDIEKGTRWDSEVAKELGVSDIGIICITPDNTERPWILFEAGALSKALDKARVCPVLFGGLKPTDVSGPLASFQLTQFEKEDFGKLVGTVNTNAGDARLDEKVLHGVFAKWWPELEEQVAEIHKAQKDRVAPERRSSGDMLEEILGLTRILSQFQGEIVKEGNRELAALGNCLLGFWYDAHDGKVELKTGVLHSAIHELAAFCDRTGRTGLLRALVVDNAAKGTKFRRGIGKLACLARYLPDVEAGRSRR